MAYALTPKAHAALAARCSVMQVADRDWWCVTHGRDADVCERETGQSDDCDPALPPFEPGGAHEWCDFHERLCAVDE